MSLKEGPFVFRVNDNGSGPNLLIQVCQERGWKQFEKELPFSNNWNLWWKTQAFPIFGQKPLLSNQVTIFLCVGQVCTERGWREYTESSSLKDGWNLWWKTSAFSVSQHKHLKAWQFTNHIPKGASICRKDNLARNLKCMKKVYGAVYDISPHGYNLPLEYTKLVADCSRRDDKEGENQKVWICKPVGQSQGRGIFLFKNLSDLCYDSNTVVQRYIKNPLLIGGYKFDLRLYVCVPSYHPLTIYLYKEGLVRFSTDKFSLADLSNPFCHLTNSSLNKLGPGYAEQKDRIGAGCKWSFRQLRQYFQQAGIRDWLLWQKITALVTLTILSQSTSVPQTTNCFEFYGFDVLIDEKLKPWLLEVNLSPALGHDCDIDPVVKKPLLHDLFDLLGLPICNTGLSIFSSFSPFGARSHSSSSFYRSLESESNESENRQKLLAKSKQKSTLSVTRLAGSGYKSTTSSAVLVATAASKWRRKRKINYMFGPPLKNSLDYDKLGSIKDCSRSPSVTPNSNFNLREPKEPPKAEDKILNLEVKDNKSGRKSAPPIPKGLIGKRCREKDGNDKVKCSSSALEIQNRGKTKYHCQQPIKTISCVDNSKLVKVDNFVAGDKSQKKKKMEMINREPKNPKNRTFENKPQYIYEKVKKSYPNIAETNIKTVMFPYDRCYSGPKGFKGRTKSHSPLLWGNGRDWRNPINKEGDWGRIYPFNNFNAKYTPTFEEDHLGNKFTVGDKQIRLVVHHVTNFIKVSKKIYYKGGHATEEELNTQLLNNLGMTGDVWLPSK